MSHKKEIEEPLDAEQAKDLELDEAPKPTRRATLRCPCRTAPNPARTTG